MNMSWDDYFFSVCKAVAEKSKDRSTKVGCVIVDDRHTIVSTGWNGFPRHVNDDIESRHERPEKYKWTEHAERNAIYNAVSRGISLMGCTIYISWYPCCDCARAIIQSGIRLMICGRPDFDDPIWGEDFRIVEQMMEEAGLGVIYSDNPITQPERPVLDCGVEVENGK